jgi:REP element-mobilizing transposase RayT
MARVLRTSLPDGYFHVYTRSVPEAPAFPEDTDRRALIVLVRQCELKFGIRVLAVTVLTTHYHLVLESPRERLSKAIQWLNACYARGFNARHGRFGSVFSERFSARVIEDEEDVPRAIDYVLANPVKAGLCDRVEDWPWSYSRYGVA